MGSSFNEVSPSKMLGLRPMERFTRRSPSPRTMPRQPEISSPTPARSVCPSGTGLAWLSEFPFTPPFTQQIDRGGTSASACGSTLFDDEVRAFPTRLATEVLIRQSRSEEHTSELQS